MSQASAAGIFTGFATGNVILLVSTATLGLLKPSAGVHYHVLLAVFTLLLSCLIQVGTFTYLSVTGKVIAQAVHLARLELSPLDAIRRNKRATARLVLLVVLSAVLTIATGAAHHRVEGVSPLHLVAVTLLAVAHGAALMREFVVVTEVSALLARTLDAYNEFKRQGGSDEHNR